MKHTKIYEYDEFLPNHITVIDRTNTGLEENLQNHTMFTTNQVMQKLSDPISTFLVLA